MVAWIVLLGVLAAAPPDLENATGALSSTSPAAATATTASPPAIPSSQPAFATSQPAFATSQPAFASSQPWLPTPGATLTVADQALGWWMAGGGTVGALAGVASLAFASELGDGPTRDLGRGTGLSLFGLGLGFLLSGIYLLATAAPGPCEASGTALSGDGPQRF